MEQKQNNWNISKEREIKLSDLLWRIVQSWRIMIVFIVIFAVIAAGVSYVKNKRQPVQNSVATEKELTAEEEVAVNRAQAIWRYLQERMDYQTNSVYINLDAYSIDTVTLQYVIKADSLDETSVSLLLESYRKYVESKALANEVGKEVSLSWDSQYIGELIDCEMNDNGSSIKSLSYQEQLKGLEGNNDQIFLITVIGRDAKEAANLADAVEKVIAAYRENLSGQIAKHDLSLLNRCESVTTNSNLALAQENLQGTIETLQTRYNTVTTNFSGAQQAALEARTESGRTDQSDMEVEVASSSISKKYVVMGVILGIVIACILVALKYILDGRIKTIEELQNMYRMRLLGSVKYEGQKKRLFSGIDRWLLSLREKNQWSLEEQIRVLLANIAVSCQKADIQKVFLTSETLDESTTSHIAAFAEQLRKDGVESVYETNIVYNAASLTHMSEIGNVILIVKEGVTKYKEFEKQLILCRDQEINILGVIFMNS